MTNPPPSFDDASVAALLAQRSRADRDALLDELVEMLSGIVPGARVEESNWGWGANAIEFFAAGTAVALMSDANGRSPLESVQPVVSFDGNG